MADELEDFIRRPEFRAPAEPPERAWEAIARRLDEEQALEEQALEEQALADAWRAAEPDRMPGPQAWEGIAARLAAAEVPAKQPRMVPLARVWQVAASFLLLLSALLAWRQDWLGAPAMPAVAQQSVGLPAELQAAEQYYLASIREKRQALEQFDPEAYGMDEQPLEASLQHLDSTYRSLRQALAESPGNPHVTGALIENLQRRIDLLNRQQQLLEQLRNMQEGQREGVDLPADTWL
jgi:hypothetical protein